MPAPPLSLYVHLPWCVRKCPYCDFNSHEAHGIPEREYVNALLHDLRRDAPLAGGREIRSVFIGGGTPSLFSAEGIATLLAGLRREVAFAADVEITLEANPGSAEGEKFHGFRAAGVNRLSLGIQSFDAEKLRALGRVHDPDQALAAVEFAETARFDSFNIDLMHGLPGQDVEAALADLRMAILCAPAHLSWYQLTIEPNTVFHNRPPLLPVEEELANIQDEGEKVLDFAGYRQYEISAYSRRGKQCRHNLNYWQFGDYLGVGAGAHGKVTDAHGDVWRYTKTRMPADYMRAQDPTAQRHQVPRDELAGEFMLNALRLNAGFALADFEARTCLSREVLAPGIQRQVDNGLLECDGDRVRASPLGRRFLDSVIAEFFD
ncbi:radical SAM family heme chaperone HemW [Mangrovimicrobium sediminis]|uniref:Heme chaperone HemW n=1 Tax=Mangrovimicrobium sediminis TaxID=2562682 RepID=A0A4Z0LZN1_9GAMM|nr:radical SAM family heme chaperone HemW [Haliea sp. SAOS-164]TGD72729.1 radical SAM family heme chaperone HemW [Haliea sp. SAOS-164]